MTLYAYIFNHTPGNVHDPRYLSNAIASYKWLKANGLFNSKGLYADGFRYESGEECDCSGSCNKDGQTFKGTYLWHLSGFCATLPKPDDPKNGSGRIKPWLKDQATRSLYQQSCRGYEAWAKESAKATWVTSVEDGSMGSWWVRRSASSKPVDGPTDEGNDMPLEAPPDSKGADYWNHGVLWDDIWPIDIDKAQINRASAWQ